MIWQGEHLVRVTSHDELRVGLTVFVDHPDGHLIICTLLRCVAAPRSPWHLCPVDVAWHAVPGNGIDLPFCFGCPIADGRLYRLQEPPAEVNDYDVVAVPTKAKERTR